MSCLRPLPGYWVLMRAAYAFILLAGTSAAQPPTPAAPAVMVTSVRVPAATVGIDYSHTLTATGGAAPYTWKLNGVLPKGLTLTSAGVLSGVPVTPSAQA